MEKEHDSEEEGDIMENAYVYLTEKRYPDGCTANTKRAIRRKASKFEVRNGELLYLKCKKMKDGTKANHLDYCNTVVCHINYHISYRKRWN